MEDLKESLKASAVSGVAAFAIGSALFRNASPIEQTAQVALPIGSTRPCVAFGLAVAASDLAVRSVGLTAESIGIESDSVQSFVRPAIVGAASSAVMAAGNSSSAFQNAYLYGKAGTVLLGAASSMVGDYAQQNYL